VSQTCGEVQWCGLCSTDTLDNGVVGGGGGGCGGSGCLAMHASRVSVSAL
jgi:hypothetical protein